MEKFAQYDIRCFLNVTKLPKSYHDIFTKEIIIYRHISKLEEINMSAGGIVILFTSLGLII